jgi:FKBP-type peptidyl-prolyl cis-trans isomerase 2
MRVEWGSLVELDYDVLLDSGEEVDSSTSNGPLRIRIGEWQALPGLGPRLVGLSEGDERLVRLTPPEAFGEWDPDAILTMRESRLSGDAPLEDGMTLRVETGNGHSAICRVFRLAEEDRVALDFNHPLAGETITVYIRVRGVGGPDRGGRTNAATRIRGREN